MTEYQVVNWQVVHRLKYCQESGIGYDRISSCELAGRSQVEILSETRAGESHILNDKKTVWGPVFKDSLPIIGFGDQFFRILCDFIGPQT